MNDQGHICNTHTHALKYFPTSLSCYRCHRRSLNPILRSISHRVSPRIYIRGSSQTNTRPPLKTWPSIDKISQTKRARLYRLKKSVGIFSSDARLSDFRVLHTSESKKSVGIFLETENTRFVFFLLHFFLTKEILSHRLHFSKRGATRNKVHRS